jgi:hypothetical protein
MFRAFAFVRHFDEAISMKFKDYGRPVSNDNDHKMEEWAAEAQQ